MVIGDLQDGAVVWVRGLPYRIAKKNRDRVVLIFAHPELKEDD